MYPLLMKRFSALFSILFCALIIIGSTLLPSSCLSPQARDKIARLAPVVIPLTQAGMTWADNTGHLPPGSSVVINKGLAVITTEGTTSEKIVQLKTLGVDEALKTGVISEGDRLFVDQAGTALVKISEELMTAKPPEIQPSPALPSK